jgi:uncharacterized membrane protein YhhN
MNRKLFLFIYVVICSIVLLSNYFDLKTTFLLSKPLIVASLLLFYGGALASFKNNNKKNALLGSLFFSLAADFTIVFANESDSFIKVSLLFMLIAKIFLIRVFVLDIFKEKTLNRHWIQLAVAALILAYGVEYFVLTYKDFGILKYPALLYILTISAMCMLAAIRSFNDDKKGFLMVLAGAVCFIVTDSVFAVNFFVKPVLFSNTIVLSSYAIAQYLIVAGVARSFRRKVLQVT